MMNLLGLPKKILINKNIIKKIIKFSLMNSLVKIYLDLIET